MFHAVPRSVRTVFRRRFAGLTMVVAILIGFAIAGPPAAEGAVPTVGLGPSATVTTSNSRSSAKLLKDGRPAAGREDVGKAWTAPARPGHWVQFRWSSAQRLTAVQIYGSGSGARVMAGALTFDDGTRLEVGEIMRSSSFPTVVSFRPQSATSVRFTVTRVVGEGTMGLAEMRVYPLGQTPLRFGAPSSTTVADDGENLACTPRTPGEVRAGVIYGLCPISYGRVRGTRTVTVHAAGLTQVGFRAWSAEPGTAALQEQVVPVVGDRARASIPFSQLRSGPVIVAIRAVAGPSLSTSTPTYLQLYNAGSPPPVATVNRPGARGRTLAYADAFGQPISISREGRNPGADYAAGKPEHWGVSEFGEAIFADPARRFDTINVVDNRYLRLAVQPNPPGYSDPNGWGRKHIGAIVGSSRPGGSGFSARYGYFEARIMAPATPGTWPAFWLLPSEHLIEPRSRLAEIDAVELYGHDPRSTCHTTHSYDNGRDVAGIARCGQRFATVSDALRWHVYGVSVEPTEIVYWIDGKVVARAPQVNGGDKPLFFMLDLSLGGGYPVQLDPVQNRAAMYVDWVRVYV